MEDSSQDESRDSVQPSTEDNLPSTLLSSAAAISTPKSSTPLPTQAPPKMKGGFEIDDDAENDEDNEVGDDDDDEADVYDPAIGLDFDTLSPAQVHETSLDRISKSPNQENGLNFTPIQANDDPAGVSFHNPTGVDTTNDSDVSATQPDVNIQTITPFNANGLTTQNVPKSRLAHDVVGILQDRIKDDPRGDPSAYLELIDIYKSRNNQDEVRRLYDQYLATFPMAADQWCAFIRWEEEHDRKYEMEKLFGRSLLEVLNVELWSIYISYIRRRNSMQSGDVARSYKIINDAFNFALKTVGMDKDSGKLWQDYVEFLKTGPGTVGGTGWQDGAKVDTLREAYQKAIAVPTSATTTLWKEYDTFETGLSKINGRKYLQEKSPAYMTARTAYTQLQNLTKDLQRTSRPKLPPAMGYEGDVEYVHQVDLWKQWINWEKEDNLVLKDEDLTLYRARILFVYKQALMALQFWPEMWYDAAEFCFSNDLDNDGTKFLTQGFEANPESPLLAFKLADRLEVSTQNDEANDPGAKERMKKVREPYDKVLDALYELVKSISTREKKSIQQIELATEVVATDGDEEVNAANAMAKKAAIDLQIDTVKKATQSQTDLISKLISYVWIALMRATRRIQGKGLPTDRGPSGFRAVFGEARKRGKLTSDFYVQSAQIEWQCYRDPTGTKILDRGMKLFPEDEYLPLQYIKHLFDINDVTNARGVFETTVNRLLSHKDSIHTAKAKPLFAFLHEYESKFGELTQIRKLETRMQELFPEDPSLKLFSQRFTTNVFDPINIFCIISPIQMQPKSIIPSVEVSEVINSPIQRVIDSITMNSPKRPPPDDVEDPHPRKLVRAESPLKGITNRRIQQSIKPLNGISQSSIPTPLPPQLVYLLSIIPKASSYVETKFDPVKMVELVRDVHLPSTGSNYPQYQQQTNVVPQGYVTAPGVTSNQYGNPPFRYA